MDKYILLTDINSFFSKGDKVTIVKDWGNLIYITNGFHRVAIERDEIKKEK